MTARSFRFHARPRGAGLALVAALGLVLAACGGGGAPNGGGPATSDFILKVAVTNELRSGPIDVSLDTPEGPGEPTTIESCKAARVEYPIPLDDWTLMIDGQTAIDSLSLADNLFEKNLIAEYRINEDGSLTEKVAVQAGSDINVPAQLGICL